MSEIKEFIDVEGIKCLVKNPNKRNSVLYYQENLNLEIDQYISSNIMTDKKNFYVDSLKLNVKISPFTLGWLEWPTDENHRRVIKGIITLDDLGKKTNKKSK